MRQHILNATIITIMCLLFVFGSIGTEPSSSITFAQNDKLINDPVIPRQVQPKKPTGFVNEENAIKKVLPPNQFEIGVSPEQPEEENAKAEESAPARPFIGGSGSLLGRGLPPPPQAIPLATGEDPDTIEPGELVVISVDIEDAQSLAEQSSSFGFSVKRRRILPGLGLVISVIRVPEGMTVSEAIKTLRENIPRLWTDANHRYQLQSGEQDDVKHYGHKLIGWGPSSNNCGAGLRIGLADTMVDTNHSALKGQRLMAHSLLTHGVKPAPMNHGTAIAALLIGSPRQASLAGLLPGAELYAAGIFRERQKHHVDTTAELVVLALDWHIDQKAVIINLSLGGPRNLIIEAAVQRVQAFGAQITAAAGNSGKKAPPVYPAAHEGVIAVTAIDARLKPYRLASRGDYISFAAPGVDIWTAQPGGGGSYASGTSFAVPFITATVGAAMIKRYGVPWSDLFGQIKKEARDLGEPGKDPVFGWGLVQALGPCANIMRHHNSSTLHLRKSVKSADINSKSGGMSHEKDTH